MIVNGKPTSAVKICHRHSSDGNRQVLSYTKEHRTIVRAGSFESSTQTHTKHKGTPNLISAVDDSTHNEREMQDHTSHRRFDKFLVGT